MLRSITCGVVIGLFALPATAADKPPVYLDTAVVFVGGLSGEVEGEQMQVSYPGFAGGDRSDLRLPGSQQKLLEALQATGKPVVLVLIGSYELQLGASSADIELKSTVAVH